MPYPVDRKSRLALLLASVLALPALAGAPAWAGTYTINGTCGLWEPYNGDPAHVAVYAQCPTLVARNVRGNFSTPAGAAGGWRFAAPPGAGISHAAISYFANGHNGWQAAAFEEGGFGYTLLNCPGATCPGAAELHNWRPFTLSGGYALTGRMRCGASSCPNGNPDGELDIYGAAVTITDTSPPGVSITGGTLLGGWRAGNGTVSLDASDNVGVRITRIYLDGALRASEDGRPGRCNYGLKVPCPNGGATLTVPTAGLADGAHTVAAQAIDSADNPGESAPVTVYTDNTAPTQPLDVTLDNPRASWTRDNAFTLRWRNPPQAFAPIVAAEYQLCPTLPYDATPRARAEAQRQCVRGTRTGTNLTRIENLSVPKEDAWSASVWLRDAAGNQQPASEVSVDGLNYDVTPPSSVAFMAQDPQDPARLRVHALDTGSGIQSGAIEARRDGEDVWRPLPTRVTDYGLSAVLDDENLSRGVYFLRARAADAAGLEQSSDRWQDGNPATVKLPIRLASRLVAGRAGRRTCRRVKTHRRHTRRRCHRRLATRPRVRVAHAVRLHGRLTVNHQPAPSAGVEVWRQLDGAGDWKRIATVTTSRTGRFSYKARRGPARTIRFRYPGTSMIRGRNADVRLRVKASTSIAANRRSVINGEYVTIHGHLRGGWIPAGGVLVELQVRARKQWRTFAQPRANARTGRWSLRYRFETVHRDARYRMRARIRRQRGFPFTSGHSREIRVRVRGL